MNANLFRQSLLSIIRKNPSLTLRPLRTLEQRPFLQCQLQNQHRLNQIALISTSKSGKEAVAAAELTKSQQDETKKPKKKYWISYGYSTESEEEDRWIMNTIHFWLFTVGIVGIGYLFVYWPDARMKNWYMREAFIELAKREAAGLPPIDPNFVPPENINLPSEEELGDFEIII